MASKRKTKRFFGGGITDEDVNSFAGTPDNDSNAGMAPEAGMTEKEPEANFKAPPKKQTFGEAFAAARKGGGKAFEFEGKKFTTELSGSKSSAPKTAVKSESKSESKSDDKPKLKYQSLQDRAKSYADERAKSGVGMYGVGMYGSKKSEPKEKRSSTPGRGVIDTSRVNPNTLLPYKKGGMVSSSASSRADGIASKGKTRGKMC